ncbi:thiamine pyrophosphate-dependent enzyme [Paraburkholderia fungorum]
MAQPLWASIGYTIRATFGAQLAVPERRTLLLVRDGSVLLTVRELGPMLRYDLKPIIILLNNSGYTVERALHGATQKYNDIATWDWQLIAKAMGRGKESLALQAATSGELVTALEQAAAANCFTIVEVHLPVFDVPPLLTAVADAVAEKNAGN